MRRRNLTIGIDLGQAFDYSALAVVERLEAENRTGLSRLTILDHYRVLWLKLWERGTDYADVVKETGELIRRADMRDAPIVLDATGVGRKVVELFFQAHRLGRLGRYWPHPFVITGGREITNELVPKRELVGVMQTALQAGRLKVADALPLAGKLRQEMQTFEVKLSPTGQETFESARDSDHDDLVIAVALAMYYRHSLTPARQLIPEEARA
jgi:hypothetical protein